MTTPSRRNQVLGKLGRIPLIGDITRRIHARSFVRAAHAFRGAYPSYADAEQALPPERLRTGYNNTDATALYRNRLDRVFPADYPVLFWLRERMPLSRVFDVGGHVGVAYYAYARYITIPSSTSWTVFDVPAVCAAGRQLAVEREARNLQFTSDFSDANGADLLLASGSLQYLEESLSVLLSRIAQRPRHLILNLLPLTDGPTYYTEQTIGVSYCPYRIESRHELLTGLGALGYRAIDQWQNPEKCCDIAFHPELSLANYDGLYLERTGN